ncbi:MAG TPA: hypothetical protein VLE89_04535 [Chlamydiales bacterium]|nr:hypothetical protein [Chlamydiales bacterium]
MTATIAVGSQPEGIAITPNGSFAYVANTGTTTVSVIQTSTNIVTATITVGTSPIGVAITPDGASAYVTNSGSANVSVITTSSNIVTATIAVANVPWGVAITADGAFAYVSRESTSLVSVIQISTNTVTAAVTVGSNPIGIATSPTALVAATTPLVTVAQLRNFFPSQTDLYTVVGWTTAGTTATYTNFQIYRDAGLTNLAGTVSNNVLRFEDHNLTAGQTYSYFVVGNTTISSQLSLGNASITIVP